MQHTSSEALLGLAADIASGADGNGLAGSARFAHAEHGHKLARVSGIRHVVRNIYGFELDGERIQRLVQRYPQVWSQLEFDILNFISWLDGLAGELADQS